MIDLTTSVFSCFGSHLSVFAMQEGRQNANRGKSVDKNTGCILHDTGLKPGFYFRNFIHRRDYETNLFDIVVPGFEAHCPNYVCLSEKLDVTEGGFELCYASATTLLLRTQRPLTLRCRRLKGDWQIHDAVFTLYDQVNHYGLRICAVSGQITVQGGAQEVSIFVNADSEIRIDEGYAPIEQIAPVPSFDQCVAERRAEYEAFLAEMPAPLPGDEQLMQLAAYGLWSAMAFARGNYTRDSMLVSKNYMCGMWSWDHCFAAMALATISPARAWDQLMCMFDLQREDGRIADCVEAVKMEWGYVKPPIHGLTLHYLREHMEITLQQRQEAYEKLSRWVMFWINTRDLNGDGLPQYLHGNDSGWDNNTVFDRPGNIQSAELPAYLIQLIDELIPLAQELEPEMAPVWAGRAQRLKEAMLSQLFVNDLPIARLADTHEQVGRFSPLPYMSFSLGMELPENIRKAMLARLKDPNFLTPYGIASEALNSPYYQLDGYSRGSIWSYGQFIPVIGLLKMGEISEAKRIMHGFLACCRKGGFSECFCSKDGQGQRDRFLNWSVCVYVMFTMLLRKYGGTEDASAMTHP